MGDGQTTTHCPLPTTIDPKVLEGKVHGAAWTCFTKDSIWNGVLPGLTGCFYYQQEGNRSISLVNALQLRDVTWRKFEEFGFDAFHGSWKPSCNNVRVALIPHLPVAFR